MTYLLFLTQLIFAAPLPLTSSSQSLGFEKDLFVSKSHQLKISAENTDWFLNPQIKKSKSVLSEYRSENVYYGVQPAITLRVNTLNEKTSLKKYMKTWMKDYPKLGFQILNSKPFKLNGEVAFLLDLYNKDNKRQLRQVITLKNKKVAIMTCRSHYKAFKKIVGDCNQIAQNFHWLDNN
ncbi:MAG: hypothetical protein MK008_10640 [Bdellovibrionales bacterium]|nr:hypothetical protein [Bdellovibrionales bacterium]